MIKNKLQIDIYESIKIKKKILNLSNQINKAIDIIYETLKNKKKILICGNGGSAADAQHLAAEFLIRLRPKVNRKPFPIISLALDSSTLTACGNDYNFKYIFSRTYEAISNKGDLLICISTSGNSKNIIEVLKKCNKLNNYSINLLGNNGGKAKKFGNLNIIVPNKNTARIQETHIFIGHHILESVENLLLKKLIN